MPQERHRVIRTSVPGPVAYRFGRSILVASEDLWPGHPDRDELIMTLLGQGELVPIPAAE